MMERLTNGIDYCKMHCDFGKSNECFFSDKDKCYERSIYNRLREYENLEEQGLLLRLPCKVGDTVYRISDMFNVRSKYIEKTKISRIAIDEDEIYVFCSCKPNVKRIFGVHVFSTKEQAEQKLREMESD